MNFKSFKMRHLLALGVIFLILTSLRLLWLGYHYPADQPLAHDGILDLRTYELKNDKTITLNGEWSFYPNTFIDPAATQEDLRNSKRSVLPVPSKGDEEEDYRFGTYWLRILIDEEQPKGNTYGISIPSAKTASTLFINGKLKAKSGEVADSIEEHIGKDMPYTAFFMADEQEIDIVVHVSNFNTPESVGLYKTIKFGTSESILKEQSFVKTLLTSIVVVLIFHSLYTILIYFFIYRKKVVLFFTAGFLLPAIDEVITYNKAALEWLHLDYDFSLKLFNLVYLGASFFFVQFMRVLLTKYQHDRRFRWITVLYGTSALAMIIMPIHYLLQANIIFFALYFLSFGTIIFFALREYIQNQQESLALAFVAVSTTSGIMWGLVKSTLHLEIPLYPFDYMFAFLGFAVFWFQSFQKKNKQAADLVQELEKADELKDEFITDSSEKLWGPLNDMITIAQTIHDGKRSSLAEQDKSDMKYLINIGRNMSFVLNNLRDFTLLKEKTLQVRPCSTNINASVSGVFDLLRFIADGKQIKMNSNIPKSFPNVLVDENRLIQILFNLLHNAIKYTNGGKIEVYAKVQGTLAEIHVRDSGLGMDQDTKNRILSPYEQGMMIDDGIGLGLYVSKQLIELHGGALRIESLPKQGSDFFFTLPLADSKVSNFEQLESSMEESAVSVDAAGGDDVLSALSEGQLYHILVVDDDPVNLKVISNIFSNDQYEVITVISGEEALDLLDKIEWDLIIVDAIMPFMSGYELTQLIRKKYSELELPILLLTARNNPEDVYPAFSFGVNDYVSKPINSLELKTRGSALIDLKHSISERLYMEAAWLQAQIQPHFLFNTLNTIASLSEIDSERMVNLLNKFGKYLRGSFDTNNLKRVVPLEHELELIRSYLYIEKERFGERLHVKWEVDENSVLEVPPLSIQPLVENAVHHGVLKKIAGGTVCIRITDHEEFSIIAIIDDGAGMSEEQISHLLDEKNKTETGRGIGLINTNRRLKRIYGQGLQISSSPGKGTTVKFTIPKIE